VITALFILGAPGAGKTTLVRGLLELDRTVPRIVDKPKWTTGPGWCAAGHYTRATFDGADTVGHAQVLETLRYWGKSLCVFHPLAVFDGDRFSYPKALSVVSAVAERTIGVFLELDDDELAARRAARGSSQDPSWAKGRLTKAVRFAEHMADAGHLVHSMDATAPTEQLVQAARDLLTW
jgi:hypothetical protein